MKTLLTLLESYTSPYEEEIFYKERMISFLKREERCFQRSLEEGHFTASAWLLNKEKTHVLLMLHAKLNIWCQLGGHADGEEDLLSVALKEAKEESGICSIVPLSSSIFDLDIHPIPKTASSPEHLHYDVRFLLKVDSDENPIANHESKALQWFEKSPLTLPSKERSLLRMMEKWHQIEHPSKALHR